MAKRIYQFRCPCCNRQLEFDAGSGKARKLAVDAGLDDLLEGHKREGARLAGAFEDALQDVAKQPDTFDELFGKALDEAKQDKDEKPRSPFDLD